MPYSKLALVYDRMGADRHSVRMTGYCREIFNRFRIHPATGLDLCCGSGTAISIFADWGIKMAGLDGSAAMLAVAAQKLKGRGVRLYQKTLPRFRLLDDGSTGRVRTFDLITCFYDSLNYLHTARDLTAAFRSVRQHLNPGGWFVFDMNTPEALSTVWAGRVYAGALDEIAWIWENSANDKLRTAECHTTCFVKRGTLYERFDEVHREKAWDNEQVGAMVERAGLVVHGLYKCHTFRKPTRRTLRIAVVAQRPR